MPRSNPLDKTSRFITLATTILIVAVLYLARDVLIPLALAMLLTFLLAPLVNRLERYRVNRIVAVLGVVTIAFGLLAIVGYVASVQVLDLANRLPEYRGNIDAKVQAIRPHLAPGPLSKAVETGKDVVEEATSQPTTDEEAEENIGGLGPLKVQVIDPPRNSVQEMWRTSMPMFEILGTAGIVVVFVLFMLFRREDLRDRLIRLAGGTQLTVTTQALDDAATRVSRYLLAQSVVNGTYGLAVAIGLWLIGFTFGDSPFPNVVLWGFLCFALRFIPYIGPWIAAAFPLLVSLAVYPSMTVFVATVIMFVVIELISNNLMEPWLYGTSTGISSVAILVAAVFWTWLWGPVGLLLSTPLTVCLVVLGKYVPQMQFLDIMLGDAPVLEREARFYQRLLALDEEEATDVAEEHLRENSLVSTYDEVVLPALGLAEQDRHRGNLDETRQRFIRNAMRRLISDLEEEQNERAAQAAEERKVDSAKAAEGGKEQKATNGTGENTQAVPADCQVKVLCLPAHDEADELAAMMFAQVLKSAGYCADVASVSALASEMMDLVSKSEADIVCVSAMPPSAILHSRYLCKRMHSRFPDLRILVGLWSARTDLKRAKERIACAGDVPVVATFEAALSEVRQLAQPTILRKQREMKMAANGEG